MRKPIQSYKRIYWIMAVLLTLAAVFLLWYANDYYRAAPEALDALESDAAVTVEEGDPLVFLPADQPVETGIIFYPGGKVDEEAYAPLLRGLAEEGYALFLPVMPLKLAVFDADAAAGIITDHPEIKEWYVGGHSLGGAMAASFAGENAEDLTGLLLLAAYSTVDLSETDLAVLSLYGSEDGVIDQERLRENAQLMPRQYQELGLAGGNHAQFGSYGAQEGDKAATISPEEQLRQTIELIANFIETRTDN